MRYLFASAAFAAALCGASQICAKELALVTEVSGTVVDKAAKPVRALDNIHPGGRLQLATGAKASVFLPEEALLFSIEGPAEVSLTPKGLVAVSGKLPEPIRLSDVYRRLRVDDPSLVQATIVMRNSPGSVHAISPEGVVVPSDARRFVWRMPAGKVRFELVTDEGALVHAVDADAPELTLPQSVTLAAGVKYTWGLSGVMGGAPLDWTEFIIDPKAPPRPDASAVSERLVHGAWLRSRSLARAAARATEGVAVR